MFVEQFLPTKRKRTMKMRRTRRRTKRKMRMTLMTRNLMMIPIDLLS